MSTKFNLFTAESLKIEASLPVNMSYITPHIHQLWHFARELQVSFQEKPLYVDVRSMVCCVLDMLAIA